MVALFAGGGGGGILGVGTPELVVIVMVAWVLLGPKRLYDVARQTGRIVGDLRRAADDARASFSEALGDEFDDARREFTGIRDELEGALRGEQRASSRAASSPSSSSRQLGAGSGPETDAKTDVEGEDASYDAALAQQAEDPSGDVDYDAAPAHVSDEAHANFLDQMQRLRDPNQEAPSEAAATAAAAMAGHHADAGDDDDAEKRDAAESELGRDHGASAQDGGPRREDEGAAAAATATTGLAQRLERLERIVLELRDAIGERRRRENEQ